MTKHEKNKLRQKIRKNKLKLEKINHEIKLWNTCCSNNLVDWDCFCSFGCNCCDVVKECSICNTRYKDKDIKRISELVASKISH